MGSIFSYSDGGFGSIFSYPDGGFVVLCWKCRRKAQYKLELEMLSVPEFPPEIIWNVKSTLSVYHLPLALEPFWYSTGAGYVRFKGCGRCVPASLSRFFLFYERGWNS